MAYGVVWYAVPQDLVVRLTPPPIGFRYVYLDGAVLLFNPTTRFVADAVSINIGINIRWRRRSTERVGAATRARVRQTLEIG